MTRAKPAKRPKVVAHRPRIVSYEPVFTPPSLPVCTQRITTQATLDWRHGNEREIRKAERLGVPLYQCFQTATYQIDGQWYCKRHAALIALDILAEDVE